MGQSNTPQFLIAAIGASAGGLEAYETFFKHMPADAGIAFAVVMHLAPESTRREITTGTEAALTSRPFSDSCEMRLEEPTGPP